MKKNSAQSCVPDYLIFSMPGSMACVWDGVHEPDWLKICNIESLNFFCIKPKTEGCSQFPLYLKHKNVYLNYVQQGIIKSEKPMGQSSTFTVVQGHFYLVPYGGESR
jgi:hypothetical protein